MTEMLLEQQLPPHEAVTRAMELRSTLAVVADRNTLSRQFSDVDLRSATNVLRSAMQEHETDAIENPSHTPIYAMREIMGAFQGPTPSNVIPTLFTGDAVIQSIMVGSNRVTWDVHAEQRMQDDRSKTAMLLASAGVASFLGVEARESYGEQELLVLASRLDDTEFVRLKAWNQLTHTDPSLETPNWQLLCGYVVPGVDYVQKPKKTLPPLVGRSAVLPEEFVDVVFRQEKFRNGNDHHIIPLSDQKDRVIDIATYARFFEKIRIFEDAGQDTASVALMNSYTQQQLFRGYCEQVASIYQSETSMNKQYALRTSKATKQLKGMSLESIETDRTSTEIAPDVNGVLVSDNFVVDCIARTLFSPLLEQEKVAYTLEKNNSDVSSVVLRLNSHTLLTVAASGIGGMNWVNILSFNTEHSVDEIDALLKDGLHQA